MVIVKGGGGGGGGRSKALSFKAEGLAVVFNFLKKKALALGIACINDIHGVHLLITSLFTIVMAVGSVATTSEKDHSVLE